VLSVLSSKYLPDYLKIPPAFTKILPLPVAYPGIFFGGVQQIRLRTEQREWGSGGSSPIVRGFTQFVNGQNPYSDYVVTELGIWPSFFKTLEFRGGFEPPKPPPWVRQCPLLTKNLHLQYNTTFIGDITALENQQVDQNPKMSIIKVTIDLNVCKLLNIFHAIHKIYL
jgi:hypothetical protein